MRHGNLDLRLAQGGADVALGPAYFQGEYSLSAGGGYTLVITDANFTKTPSGTTGATGVVGNGDGEQELTARSIGGQVAVRVADALEIERLRRRPVDGIKYPCQVNPNAPGCYGPQVGCTSCG